MLSCHQESKFEELRLLHARLESLLNEASPGLQTWQDAISNVLKEISDNYTLHYRYELIKK